MAKLIGFKECTCCGILKELTEENFYKRSRGDYQATCKICFRAKVNANKHLKQEHYLEYNRQYYRENRKAIQASKKRLVNSDLTSRLKHILRNSKGRAEKKGWDFNLTLEDLETQYRFQDGRCAYSGIPLEVCPGDNMISIDRIDSTKGYTYDNIQFSTYQINLMKRDIPHETFIKLCKLVAREE